MNNIVIGQYVPRDSWLHRLDPRIKILSLIFLIASIFVIPIPKQWPYQWPLLAILGAITLFIIILIISSKVPILKVIKGLRPVMFLLAFTFVIQIFFFKEGTALNEPIPLHFSWSSLAAIIGVIVFYYLTKRYVPFKFLYFLAMLVGVFAVQYALPYGPIADYNLVFRDIALMRSIFLVVRIVNVIMLTSLLTLTTMTTELNQGIESLLKPLKWIKVPVDTLAMMISLTLRYIPTLLEETQKIMKAQASRGVDFKESKLHEKIRLMISLLIPIFIISFKRAEDLSNAMEARGYQIGVERTKVDAYKMGFFDVVALIFAMAILGLIIAARFTVTVV